MNIRCLAVVTGLLLAGQGLADSRDGWGYRKYDDRGATRSYQYDPRSPYPQHPVYPPSRYQQIQPPHQLHRQIRPDQRLKRWHEQGRYRHEQRGWQGHRHDRSPHDRFRANPPRDGFNQGYGYQPRIYQPRAYQYRPYQR